VDKEERERERERDREKVTFKEEIYLNVILKSCTSFVFSFFFFLLGTRETSHKNMIH